MRHPSPQPSIVGGIKKESREFAFKELHFHWEQEHNIDFDVRGGFFCQTCGIGCVGEDVGDLRITREEDGI